MSKKSDFYNVTVKEIPRKNDKDIKNKSKKFKIKPPRGIFAASGEKIKAQRTMRFWFTFAIRRMHRNKLVSVSFFCVYRTPVSELA